MTRLFSYPPGIKKAGIVSAWGALAILLGVWLIFPAIPLGGDATGAERERVITSGNAKNEARAKEEPEAPPEERPKGKLEITTDVRMQGLNVYLQDKLIGTVPLTKELPEGEYTVKVSKGKKKGKKEKAKQEFFQRAVNIRGEETLRLIISYTLHKTLIGHDDDVAVCCFSPDGKLLASGGGYKDKTIRIWDTTSWREVKKIERSARSIRSLSFSPDGKILAAGLTNADMELNVYASSDWSLIKTFASDSQNYATWLSFSPDGKLLAATGGRHENIVDTVTVYDTSTWQELTRLKARARNLYDGVLFISFTPDGKTLLSTGGDGQVNVWDTSDWRRTRTFRTREVRSLCFSPDGKTMLVAYPRKDIGLWDTSNWREIKTLGTPWPVNSLSFRPDGKILLCESGWTLIFWDASKWEITKFLPAHTEKTSICATAFSRDGKTIASGGTDKTARIWKLTLAEKKEPTEKEKNFSRTILRSSRTREGNSRSRGAEAERTTERRGGD